MKSTIPSTSGTGPDASRQETTQRTGAPERSRSSRQLSTLTDPTCIEPRAAWRIAHATAGDHPLIHQFLLGATQKPSAAEFQAQVDDPTYEPSDRLLIKVGKQIVAHLRLVRREMRFGRLLLPVGLVVDLVTAPEYRGHGCATSLLQAARKQLLADGAVLGLLRTNLPRFYARRGWTVCGRHCYSSAGPRAILSHLTLRAAEQLSAERARPHRTPRKKYNIRLWRHVEQAALIRLYNENTLEAHGVLDRSEAYWRWLVRRGGNDRIYVAIDGPDKLELDETLAPIVGYAATKNGRIVEMMCAAEHPEASIQLLARACGDAMEQDDHRIRVDAPPGHPLHMLCVASDGDHYHHEADQGMVFMADLLKPRRFVKMMSRDLGDRAKEAGHQRPCQLGLLVTSEKYRLDVSRKHVDLAPGSLGRSYLRCSRYDLTQLLLGHLDVHEAVDSGRITASTHWALELAETLLPRLPLWRPPWDELPAP